MNRVCTNCQVRKPIERFRTCQKKGGVKYVLFTCKDCFAAYQRKRRPRKSKSIEPLHKVCTDCKKDKKIEDFELRYYKGIRGITSRRRCTCKKCLIKRRRVLKSTKAWKDKNNTKKKERKLWLEDVRLLRNRYIKRHLWSMCGCPKDKITPELIEAKRQQLILKRKLEEYET